MNGANCWSSWRSQLIQRPLNPSKPSSATGSSPLPQQGGRDTETTNIVVRLAESAQQWKHQDVDRRLQPLVRELHHALWFLVRADRRTANGATESAADRSPSRAETTDVARARNYRPLGQRAKCRRGT